MSKILIIGASGSLGKGVSTAISSFHDVTGTYLNSSLTGNIKKTQLDVRKVEAFNSLDTDFDTVILVAGSMPAAMNGYQQQQYIDVNITGTLNTLEFCRKNNIKKIIYVMTFSDVSEAFHTGVPIKETDARTITYTGDHAVYAISKITACELIEHYHQEYNLQTIIFRIPTVYCDDDNINFHVDGKEREKAYVSMIKSVMHNKTIQLWGDPKKSKDMPYIKDFARLINKAINHPSAQGLFNAGTGNPVSLEEFVNAIIDVFGNKEEIKKTYLLDKPSQPNFTFDMSKTNNTFDFSPEYSIRDMLQEIKINVFDDAQRSNKQ